MAEPTAVIPRTGDIWGLRDGSRAWEYDAEDTLVHWRELLGEADLFDRYAATIPDDAVLVWRRGVPPVPLPVQMEVTR